MLVLNRDDSEHVADWMAGKLGAYIHQPAWAFGIIDDTDPTELRGGVLFNGYTKADVEITLYAPGCFRRHLIRDVFEYVFNELKCLRLTARTRRGNKEVCRLLPRLGFDYEATIKNHFGPLKKDDAILFRLTHDYASRWM